MSKDLMDPTTAETDTTREDTLVAWLAQRSRSVRVTVRQALSECFDLRPADITQRDEAMALVAFGKAEWSSTKEMTPKGPACVFRPTGALKHSEPTTDLRESLAAAESRGERNMRESMAGPRGLMPGEPPEGFHAGKPSPVYADPASPLAAPAPGPLPGFPTEWGIALIAGRAFVGRPVTIKGRSDGDVSTPGLSPVYELRWVDILMQTRDPSTQQTSMTIQTTRMVGPVLGLSSWEALAVPETGLVWQPLPNLSDSEVGDLKKQLLTYEDQRAAAMKQAQTAEMARQAASTKGFGGGAR